MDRLEAFKFDSFDDFADMIQNEENLKNKIKPKDQIGKQPKQAARPKVEPVKKPEMSKSSPKGNVTVIQPSSQTIKPKRFIQTATRYRRKTTGPIVISIEEFNERVKKGEIKAHQVPPPSKAKKETSVKTEPKKTQPKNIDKKRKEEKTKVKKQSWSEKRKIAKKAKQIAINTAHQTRYTEPKKRNLLARIILQHKYQHGRYDDIEEDLEEGYITKKDVDNSKKATKRKDKLIYKEVQSYEDAVEDVTVRRGWTAFKVGLVAALLSGSILLANNTYNQIVSYGESVNSANQIVSIYEMNQEDQASLVSTAQSFRQTAIEADGYHFNYLTDMELADGYNRMMSYEKKMTENQFRSSSLRIDSDGDQALLDKIVERSFDEETYNSFSEEQKRDLKQLAFELLPYSLPDIFGNGINYVRNPLVMEHLEARNNAIAKGYKMTIRVNNDEKETVRNLGSIRQILLEMAESDYSAVSSENGQQEFFDDILVEVMGEEKYEQLDKNKKRDYQQLIYEWLSPEGKQVIRDPIEVAREGNQAQYGMEIGD